MNTQPATTCVQCTSILDEHAARQAHEQETTTHALLLRVYELLAKKGLLDDAADEIHNAGLGASLKRLATVGNDPTY